MEERFRVRLEATSLSLSRPLPIRVRQQREITKCIEKIGSIKSEISVSRNDFLQLAQNSAFSWIFDQYLWTLIPEVIATKYGVYSSKQSQKCQAREKIVTSINDRPKNNFVIIWWLALELGEDGWRKHDPWNNLKSMIRYKGNEWGKMRAISSRGETPT